MIEKKITNLTLAEALHSGRPYKRFYDRTWNEPSSSKIMVSLEEIEARDYMIKPEPLRLKIYVSPCQTHVTMNEKDADWSWDYVWMIEEEK